MREKKGKVHPLCVSYEMEERCMVDLGGVAVDVAGMRARYGWQPERGNVYLFGTRLESSTSSSSRHGKSSLSYTSSSSSVTSTTGSSSQQEKGIHFPYNGLHRDLRRRFRPVVKPAEPSRMSWPDSTPSICTSACTAAHSRSVPHGQWSLSSTLPRRPWAPPTSASILNSTRPCGRGESRLSLIGCGLSLRVHWFFLRLRISGLILFVVFIFLGKRNDEENAKEKLYTYVSHVPVTSFKVFFFPSFTTACLRSYRTGPANDGRGCRVISSPGFVAVFVFTLSYPSMLAMHASTPTPYAMPQN